MGSLPFAGVIMRPVHAMVVLGIVVLIGGAAYADIENLTHFLRRAEEATHVTVAVRGDGEFAVQTPEATRRNQVAMIVRPPADIFLALRQERIKALLLGNDGHLLKTGAATAGPFHPAATFAESDFTREDLETFRLSRFKDWRISDESGTELTVMLVPQDSQYSLVVITFDREKKVPLKTLYYRETLSNLVKMRRDEAFVFVGRMWMPGRTSMETFKLHTQTTFTMRWTEDSSLPSELFDPAALPHAGIVWPPPPSVGPGKEKPGTSGG
jgi:hypothetical protein